VRREATEGERREGNRKEGKGESEERGTRDGDER